MSNSDLSAGEIRRRAHLRVANANKRKFEAAKAMMDYNDARVAERAKTARLRALRLAKETEDAKKEKVELAKPRKTPRKRKTFLVS